MITNKNTLDIKYLVIGTFSNGQTHIEATYTIEEADHIYKLMTESDVYALVQKVLILSTTIPGHDY